MAIISVIHTIRITMTTTIINNQPGSKGNGNYRDNKKSWSNAKGCKRHMNSSVKPILKNNVDYKSRYNSTSKDTNINKLSKTIQSKLAKSNRKTKKLAQQRLRWDKTIKKQTSKKMYNNLHSFQPICVNIQMILIKMHNNVIN